MRRLSILTGSLVTVLSFAAAQPVRADPVTVTGFLSSQPFGALASTQLILRFPDFAVLIEDQSAHFLAPGFCLDCNGPVAFSQQTGKFTAHSKQSVANATVDADVTGHLSFSGPTNVIEVPDCGLSTCEGLIPAPVRMSGFLTVRQPGRTLFHGELSGSGTANGLYVSSGLRGVRWDGSEFKFAGATVTPEPASMILIGTGALGVLLRRRRRTAHS